MVEDLLRPNNINSRLTLMIYQFMLLETKIGLVVLMIDLLLMMLVLLEMLKVVHQMLQTVDLMVLRPDQET